MGLHSDRHKGLTGMLRIAQVAPLYESVPPKGYGGTERVVSYLTEELVRQGHQVTLFASGDSETAAELVPPRHCSLRLDNTCIDQIACHVLMLEQVFRQADMFDVIHFHIDYLHYPLTRRRPHPNLTTLHGRLDIPELAPLYDEFPEMPVVSISDSQRRPLPQANWQGTANHGLPPDLVTIRPRPGDYLAFLGRISPAERFALAILNPRPTAMPLKVHA